MLYEVRINGRLSEAALAEFSDLVATVEPPRTVLRGPSLDQSGLTEVLDRVARLGLQVEEVRRLEVAPENGAPAAEAQRARPATR
jgi:hypothetical protein